MIYPALSIRQPWAWAILHAGKDVENRSARLPHQYMGIPILIHTGKKVDLQAGFGLVSAGYLMPPPAELPTGGIVGVLMFTGAHKDMNTYYVSGQAQKSWAEVYKAHWIIEKAAPLPFFACKGRLGFFTVDYPYEVRNLKRMKNDA